MLNGTAWPPEMRMSIAARSVVCLACLWLAAPLSAAGTDADARLESRIAAMGRIGSAVAPQYSPDGTQIAFITTLSGSPQLWRIPADGGYPQQLTAFADPVSGARWAPDGKHIAFAVAPGGGYNAKLYRVTADGVELARINADDGANTFAGDFADDGRYHFRSNARSADATDAWIWDPATRKASLSIEMDGLGGIADLKGSKALVWRLVTRGNSNLWLDDMKTGETVLLTPHEGPASVDGLFGADATTVFLEHNLGIDRSVFARIDIDADDKPSAPQTLASRDGAELDQFILSRDRLLALLIWNVGGRNELEIVNLKTGEREPVPTPPVELVLGGDFAPDGRHVVLSMAGSNAPADLWRLGLAGNQYTRLTFSPHTGVDLAQLVRPELREFKAHDGLALSGWLYTPPGFKKPGPVVLSFHGGPEGQDRPGFRADYQALLASGIAVFAPNIRGSSGFGKAFMQLDNHEGRFDANRDIKASADFLVEAGIGDKDRLGIMGGSYGGYAVMVGVTEFPDTFAAGVNLFGMVNFETFFAQSTPWMGAISTGEYGDPKTQRELLRKLSPIHKLDRVQTPLLVMHGANDTNVPVVEAEQVVNTLKERDIEVDYVLFPDEGHGWRKEANRVRSTLELTRFFSKHLLGDVAAD
jgi:dipeptidyl aminopeptidase/acylaminoacyl peptidase